LLKHQLLISNRSCHRAPHLATLDRVLGLTTLLVSARRMPKLGARIRPETLFKFHKALVDRKYRLLFSSVYLRRKPGPKGPSAELIATTRCFASTAGSPTCASSKSRRSSQFRMLRSRIRSLNG